jgi:hypothetical protein
MKRAQNKTFKNKALLGENSILPLKNKYKQLKHS